MPPGGDPAGGGSGVADGTIGQAVSAVLALNLPLDVARRRVVDEFEARYLAKVLDEHQGNVSRAALASGVARRHFHRLLARARSRPT